MSKPIDSTTATPLTFEQRLKLVQAEVYARVAAYPTEQQNGIRAYMWCGWIKKTVLEAA